MRRRKYPEPDPNINYNNPTGVKTTGSYPSPNKRRVAKKPNEHMRLKPKPAKKPNEHMRLKPKTGQAIYPSHVASAASASQWRALQKHLSEAALQAYKDRMR